MSVNEANPTELGLLLLQSALEELRQRISELEAKKAKLELNF